MIIALVILILSFLAIVAMLGAKHYEVKAGRQLVAVSARKWSEERIRRGGHAARGVARTAFKKHFWTGLSSFVWSKLVDGIWKHPRVQAVTKKATDVVRGKKEIKSTGPVSFYLKDVGDHKKHIGKQTPS